MSQNSNGRCPAKGTRSPKRCSWLKGNTDRPTGRERRRTDGPTTAPRCSAEPLLSKVTFCWICTARTRGQTRFFQSLQIHLYFWGSLVPCNIFLFHSQYSSWLLLLLLKYATKALSFMVKNEINVTLDWKISHHLRAEFFSFNFIFP